MPLWKNQNLIICLIEILTHSFYYLNQLHRLKNKDTSHYKESHAWLPLFKYWGHEIQVY